MKRATKEKILKIALHEFALKGYRQTTTRDILTKADANIAAISYYFGNKDGLYTEILKTIREKLGHILEDVANQADPDLNPKKSALVLKAFIHKLVSLVCSDKVDADMCMIYIREYMEPSSQYKVLFTDFNNLYRGLFIDLLIKAHKKKLSLPEASLSAVMVFSFVFTLYTRRNMIQESMGWTDYSESVQTEIETMLYRSLNLA